MNHVDERYCELIRACLEGERVRTRNADCFRTICRRVDFDSTPLVGARRTAWRNSLREWQWFMSGSDRLDELHEKVRPWWAPWADAAGEIANSYGGQFRRSAGRRGAVDQIERLIAGVREHPYSRRNVATTWNAADMAHPSTPLTTCHGTVIQCFVEAGDRLTLRTYQRSCDVVVGLGSNWLQYWGFLLWLASRTGRKVGRLLWEGGDVHVYAQHEGLARRILEAADKAGPTPTLRYEPTAEDFLADDFRLEGEYRPALEERAEMVV